MVQFTSRNIHWQDLKLRALFLNYRMQWLKVVCMQGGLTNVDFFNYFLDFFVSLPLQRYLLNITWRQVMFSIKQEGLHETLGLSFCEPMLYVNS